MRPQKARPSSASRIICAIALAPILATCSSSSNSTPTQPAQPQNDAVTQSVGPGGGTVVTPSGAAGVQIPAGTFSQAVMLTITRLPAPTSAGAGPLPTSLKQYGPYYDFTTSPEVAQFGDSARVGVCQVTDPSSPFYPPEPHDRLRLAHTVGATIEILDRVGANDFLRCTNVSASTDRANRHGLRGVLLAIRDAAIGPLRPATLYAAHGGLGGKVKSFSPFGAVDPGNFTVLAAGSFHSCGLTSDGKAYCWGANTEGELGNGTTTGRSAPTAVAGALAFTSLALGYQYTCGLTSSGAAYCWGYNFYGELGDGTLGTNRLTPTAVAGGVTFASLTINYQHTCGLTSAGVAYCWGYNASGRLGDGTTTDRFTPTQVVGGLTFTSLAAGGIHTCGLTSGGTAYCWGENANGEIGDGTTTDRLAPTRVIGGLTFTILRTGYGHNCGLTSDGTTNCWGYNAFGELGDGTTTSRLRPTPVVGGPTFTSLALGWQHACGLTSGGAAYCWGDNAMGGLGDGTITSRATPTQVIGGLTFQALSIGAGHSCGLTSSATAYCWGNNSAGQLGDATTTNRLTPTLVAR